MGLEFETEIAEAQVARGGPATGSVADLWRNRDFKVVLGGQGVSALGDAVSYTALPLLVLALTGSGVLMGVVGILQTLRTCSLASSPALTPTDTTGAA